MIVYAFIGFKHSLTHVRRWEHNHNQALKENHTSFKWRPWVFNFNSHQLCSSTWTLTLFLGTVIPPTRIGGPGNVKYHKYAKTQMMHDETRDIFRGGSTASLAQGSLKCLHELYTSWNIRLFPVLWAMRGRDGWLVMWNVPLVPLLAATIPELLSTAALKIRTISKSYELELSSRP